MKEELVYDVGMHEGHDTAYYLHCGYDVVAIEADPKLVEAAEERFAAELAEGDLTIVHAAISENDGEAPFWICEDNRAWNSFHREIAARDGANHRRISVPTRRFRAVLDTHGVPWYLKIDIEGSDELCVRDISSDDTPRYLSIEKSEKNAERMLEELDALGYDGFKLISQYHYLPVQLRSSREQERYEQALGRLRNRGLLRKLLDRLRREDPVASIQQALRTEGDWTFPQGASGPFGEATSGYWQDLDEMLATYREYQQRFERGESSIFWTDASYSFWADFHARRSDTPVPPSS